MDNNYKTQEKMEEIYNSICFLSFFQNHVIQEYVTVSSGNFTLDVTDNVFIDSDVPNVYVDVSESFVDGE